MLRYPRTVEEQPESEWCDCDRQSQDRSAPTWGDLRSRRRLCWCCATARADGGSKWTVHTCEPCMKDIQQVNRFAQRLVAPIGRHSLMHGIGDRDPDGLVEPEVAAALAVEFNGMFAGIDRASLHGRFRAAELAQRFGLFGQQRIPADEFLEAAAAAHVDRSEGLVSLIQFMRNPLLWVRGNPQHRTPAPRGTV